MLIKIRNSRFCKLLAAFLAVNLSIQIFLPSKAYALTGGPSQPEVQSFEPIGTSEMVNLFSGDFTYNIPLMDVGGYPLNISYNSNITMDQEASWVGLGWNINPGVINRQKRGLPDDFNGSEEVTTTTHMKNQITAGVSASGQTEIFGKRIEGLKLDVSYGIQYNNYTGVSVVNGIGGRFSATKGSYTGSLGLNLNAGEDGLNISPSASFEGSVKHAQKGNSTLGSTVGATINTRQGLKSFNTGVSARSQYNVTKNNKTKVGRSMRNGGSSISLAASTYTPQISSSMKNFMIGGTWSAGPEAIGGQIQASVNGWYSEQKLLKESESKPAFGYLYSDQADGDPNAIHDFNREKDAPFNPNHSSSLPLTNYTYDIYSAVGQGIGSMFRPKRGQVGSVYDNEATNTSTGTNFGIETGLGAYAKLGGDFGMDLSNSRSGKWDCLAASILDFSSSDHDTHENFYFKQAGEKTPIDQNYFNEFQDWRAVRVQLSDPYGMNVVTKSKFENGFGASWSFSDNSQDQREKRNLVISYLTKGERSQHAADPDRTVYDQGGSSTTSHHIGEFVAYKDDGSRYVYGLPVYNTVEKEVTFNISGGANKDCAKGLISYNSQDASKNNDNGRDNYYQKVETPPYAYAYLLTEVLSPDYVDYDAINGPSDGDLGNYTQIHYKDITSSSMYKWRVPVTENKVAYSEGIKADPDDDRGNYLYGEKEIYYVDSIVTKTHIAIFHTSAREDGYEVKGETGGINSASGLSMHKLDSVSLYSKPDFRDNGFSAEPIKRVHFEYDYSLCGTSSNPIPNNSGTDVVEYGSHINTDKGKLTLKKLYFTYGNSFKAKLSPYEFNYADLDHNGTEDANPVYNLKGYDRWGNYKPNSSGSCVPGGTISAPEYPYTDQNKTNTDSYTASWSLTSILLPSGGKIEVDYESDDYAYVQNRRAMRMFKVVGMANTTPTDANLNTTSKLFDAGTSNTYQYIVVQLAQQEAKATYSKERFKYEYLLDILNNYDKRLYFKYFIDLTGKGNWDYVPGYAEIEDWDVVGSGSNYTHAYLKVKSVPRYGSGSPNRNPMMKAAWNYAKSYIPTIAFGHNVTLTGGVGNIIKKQLFPIIDGVTELFRGANGTFEKDGYAHSFNPDKSWIRLCEPDGVKLGGGSRVKQVRIYDMWDGMTSTEQDYDYGQEYSYTVYDPYYGEYVSSGVAAYEPLAGADENPFRQPVFTNEEKLLAPDQEHYVERPFGESFFPGASVGYSRVVVKNLERVSGSQKVKRHATGKVVNEFYTAKDFPTIVQHTVVDVKPAKSSLLGRIFKFNYKDYLTASQGYSVINNDMHGKQKSQFVYAERQATPISGVRYHYSTSEIPYTANTYMNNTNGLDNTVTTIDKDGTIRQELMGIEFDIVGDFREFGSKNKSFSIEGNGDLIAAGPIPVLTPTVWPSYKSTSTRFRSAVMTKVINWYGIQTKTEAYDLGSRVVTENLAWDHTTGEVLVTKTQNDFEDPIYSTTYPAHWSYERMGGAYENIRASLLCKIDNTDGNILTTAGVDTDPSYLHKGDEVKLNNFDSPGGTYDLEHGWLWDNNDADNKIFVIKDDGSLFTGFAGHTTDKYVLTVMRSGKRNMAKTPVGSVTSLKNPLKDTNSDGDYDTFTYADQSTYDPNDWEVINSSAVEFSEEWGNYYCEEFDTDCSGCTDANCIQYNLQFPNPRIWNVCTLDASGYTTTTVQYGSGTCPQTGGGTANLSIQAIGPNPGQYQGAVVGLFMGSDVNFFDFNPIPCNEYQATAKVEADGFIVPVLITSDVKIQDCSSSTPSMPNLVVNPYVEGIRGNFRPQKSYLYLGERVQRSSGTDNNLDIREDGQYVDFNPFWDVNSGADWTKDASDWTYTSEVTQYNPYGAEVENKDALDRYSAAVYGYTEHLPVAVASNASFNNIAFDGFEDYDFYTNVNCTGGHFGFRDNSNKLTSSEAHTGSYSMELTTSTTISSTYPLQYYQLTGTDDVPYTLKRTEDNINIFAPITYRGDVTYVVSYWVKEDVTGLLNDVKFNNVEDYTTHSVNIKHTPLGSSTSTLTPSNVKRSPIIDGWQKVEFEVTVYSLWTGDFVVELQSGSNTAYFDDIRIQPKNSSMKSFVYDPVSLRLVAELDENNFATMYEYDEEGALTRIKKETAKGVKTIQESRNSQYKKIP